MKTLVLFLLLFFLCACGATQVPNSSSNTISGDFDGAAIGAYVNGMENIGAFQTMAGKNLAVVLWYVHWTDPFPTSDANLVDANDSIPLITWEPWVTNEAGGTLEAIVAGSYDSYVREFLQAAKDWGKPLFLRFAHEMNGNWYPWDGHHNEEAAGPEKYKAAFIYLYNVREELGADNVSLVWCVNNTNVPDESWNTPSAYYPGDQYVDWIGIDGYNWGYGAWQDFDQVFESVYQTITALSNKPLMIGEFASAKSGGDKAAWITDTFSKMQTDYPRIKLFCWFDINKERDWRINSSADAQASFAQAISDSYFVEKMIE
ncbi:MAG: hypothetical protein HQ596_03570 [Candidatus Saganbacteria bacterium]|nr:hypothetical protein [Candidatus Saganbacteria bacterium]